MEASFFHALIEYKADYFAESSSVYGRNDMRRLLGGCGTSGKATGRRDQN